MESSTLTIGGKEYPLRFPMAAITRVMRELDVNTYQLSVMIQEAGNTDENATAEEISDNYSKGMKIMSVMAWAGIYSGEKFSNPLRAVTFQTVDDLAEQVETLSDITPAFVSFIDAFVKFTGANKVKESKEGEVIPLLEVKPD